MNGENVDEIKRLTETLTHASHALAQAMYQQAGPSAGQHTAGSADGAYGSSTSANDDEVVDAEYEEVR